MLNFLLQRVEFAPTRLFRPTTGQPNHGGVWGGRQPLAQGTALSPCSHGRRYSPHLLLHPITEVEQTCSRAVSLRESNRLLAHSPELILFTHPAQSRVEFSKPWPPPIGTLGAGSRGQFTSTNHHPRPASNCWWTHKPVDHCLWPAPQLLPKALQRRIQLGSKLALQNPAMAKPF